MTKRQLLLCGTFVIVASMISACSLPRTMVLIDDKNDFSDDSYYLEPIIISQTLASAASINDKLSQFKDEAEAILKKKNYNLTSKQDAKFKIRIYVASEPRGAVTKDDLRFRKGTHPSHFPDANPRARSLEADFLVIQINRLADAKPTYQAKCQLIEGQETLPVGGFGEITTTNINECLKNLIQ
jgi:hypothetical protein